MSSGNDYPGVPKCYIFKSRLQEYAQKEGIRTPVYETTKEGPSHEPSFSSTVTVNEFTYNSLPGFFNRKAAEQSAAEVALMELAKSGNMSKRISNPVHETGLCKNLLQEYAQKLNYAIPSYVCQKDETPGKISFTCTVEIGGIQYIGAAARTKREAEIKAARTALLAIQSHDGGLQVQPSGSSQYTVVPCRKKGTESNNAQEGTKKALKPKKACFKKKWGKKKGKGTKPNQSERVIDNAERTSDGMPAKDTTTELSREDQGTPHMGSKLHQNAESGFNPEDSGMLVVQVNQNFQNAQHGESDFTNRNTETSGLLPVQSRAGAQTGDSGIQVVQVNQNFQSTQHGESDPTNGNTETSGLLPVQSRAGVQTGDSGIPEVQVNRNFQSTQHGESDPTNGNTETSGLLPVQSSAGVQVGNSGMLVADTSGNSQDAQPGNLDFKQNGHVSSNLGFLPAVQLEDLKAFPVEGNKISGTGQATSMASTSLSIGGPLYEYRPAEF